MRWNYMANNLAVVIAAAGTGSRMKSDINKQYILINEKPVLYYSLECFSQMDLVKELVVVAHPDEVAYCQENIIDKYQFTKAKVISGGQTRQESVVAGLKSLNSNVPYVAVHDGARPLVVPSLVLQVLKAAVEHGAAIPAVFATDTMKLIDAAGFVEKTLDRARLIAVQTPQIFNYRELIRAYDLAKEDNFIGTDDASLYEKYIGKVKTVISDTSNIKITRPEDIIIAKQLMSKL